jgi:SAM-dependent methyltransferase
MKNNQSAAKTDSVPDMGATYDGFAAAFRKADQLTTWKYVGKPALQKVLAPCLKRGMKILDLGSASARVPANVLLPGGVRPEDITGVEISPEQVEMAKVRIPGATFLVGDIADPDLFAGQAGVYDAVDSSMVFEHVSDEQFAQVCANAHRLLKQGGLFAFLVTHPDKMKGLDGKLLTTYGAFETTVPWGGVVHNWRRSIETTLATMRDAGFEVTLVEELAYPAEVPAGLAAEDLAKFEADGLKYRKDKYIRLAVQARRLP